MTGAPDTRVRRPSGIAMVVGCQDVTPEPSVIRNDPTAPFELGRMTFIAVPATDGTVRVTDPLVTPFSVTEPVDVPANPSVGFGVMDGTPEADVLRTPPPVVARPVTLFAADD